MIKELVVANSWTKVHQCKEYTLEIHSQYALIILFIVNWMYGVRTHTPVYTHFVHPKFELFCCLFLLFLKFSKDKRTNSKHVDLVVVRTHLFWSVRTRNV